MNPQMIYRRLSLLFILLLFCFALSSSQEQCLVAGRVFDVETRAPVSNVNIIVRGTRIGTTTDNTGAFRLQLPIKEQYVLVFSHIAYRKATRSLSTDSSSAQVSIALQPDAIALGEVVVTGKKTFVPTKAAEQRATFKIGGDEFERLGEERMERAMIYLLPNIVKPLFDRLNNAKDDFTLYVDGEWKESAELDDVDPFRIVRVLVWHAPGREHPIDIFPIGLPLRRGSRYVILVETK